MKISRVIYLYGICVHSGNRYITRVLNHSGRNKDRSGQMRFWITNLNELGGISWIFVMSSWNANFFQMISDASKDCHVAHLGVSIPLDGDGWRCSKNLMLPTCSWNLPDLRRAASRFTHWTMIFMIFMEVFCLGSRSPRLRSKFWALWVWKRWRLRMPLGHLTAVTAAVVAAGT